MRKTAPFLASVMMLSGCSASAGTGRGYRPVTAAEAIVPMNEEKSYMISDIRTREG